MSADASRRAVEADVATRTPTVHAAFATIDAVPVNAYWACSMS